MQAQLTIAHVCLCVSLETQSEIPISPLEPRSRLRRTRMSNQELIHVVDSTSGSASLAKDRGTEE